MTHEDLYYKNYYLNRAKKMFFNRISHDDLLDLESKVGSKIFGEAPNGVRREFFNTSETTWIWHEEWTDAKGTFHQRTVRYEIRGEKIIKIQPGPRYFEVKGKELENFHKAVNAYHKAVLNQIYRKNVR